MDDLEKYLHDIRQTTENMLKKPITSPENEYLKVKAFKLYSQLADAIEKQIPSLVVTVDSIPHERCPACKNAVKVYYDDPEYPYCKWCGQRLIRSRKGDD